MLETVFIALTAFVLRAAVFLIVTSQTHWSLAEFANQRDGEGYLLLAQQFLGRAHDIPVFDQRLFPGYPALLALLGSSGLPLSLMALAFNWLAAAGIAVCSLLVFKDRRVGWAMAVLTPTYLLYSSMVMS